MYALISVFFLFLFVLIRLDCAFDFGATWTIRLSFWTKYYYMYCIYMYERNDALDTNIPWHFSFNTEQNDSNGNLMNAYNTSIYSPGFE